MLPTQGDRMKRLGVSKSGFISVTDAELTPGYFSFDDTCCVGALR